MKVTLYLMTQKGLSVLQALIKNGYSTYIHLVVIGRDKHLIDDASENIKVLCQGQNINFTFDKKTEDNKTPYLLAISWRWLIKQPAESQLIVLHDSLLPKYRGFAPLVNMLINGEPKIGVTAIFATEEYDRGDIIAQASRRVAYPIKIQEAIELVSGAYEEAVLSVFSQLKDSPSIQASPQDESEATYSLWRNADDYRLNWEWDSQKIQRAVNALGAPYQGACALMNKQQLVRIWEVEVLEDVKVENRDIGKVIFMQKGKPVVVCGKGLVKILQASFEDGTDFFPLKSFRNRFY